MSSPKTYLIFSEQDDPATNLAAEDVLLNNTADEYIFLYINRPTVVIGKHQNPYSEANLSFCKKHGIGIHRRLSGGGTVFHDHGNVNFCFIRNMEDQDRLIDFGRFLKPVQDYLLSKGIVAEFSGRNDLLVEGFKVSGNAEHVVQKTKRVIHHGTLLFDTELRHLGQAIHPNPNVTVKSHAVHSVRSAVRNLKGYGDLPETADLFARDLGNYLANKLGAEPTDLSHFAPNIDQLRRDKYANWDWNFGYTPHYSMRSLIAKDVFLEVEVRKSFIEKALLISENKTQIELVQLIGKRHHPEELAHFITQDHTAFRGLNLPEDLLDWF